VNAPFKKLSEAASTVAAYSTAVQLGLLDRIDREPAAPAELARSCGAHERGVRVVLAALEPGGFVERMADGRYRPTVPGLASLHPILPLWDHLPESTRTGRPVFAGDDPATAAEVYPAHVAFLAGLWQDQPAEVAQRLRPPKRLLDVGAGAAPWSIALATASPSCRVTALDLPPVLRATRHAVSRAGLDDRFDYLPGDMFNAVIAPESYDLILIGQVCHLFDEPSCAELIRDLVPALEPGGTFAVVDAMAGGPTAAACDLSLYLRTRRGAVHPPKAYRGWLEGAGLVDVDAAEIGGDGDTVLITGTRR
jgi:SAM-dependent methyltransferase